MHCVCLGAGSASFREAYNALFLVIQLLVIGTANQIINAWIIIVCKSDEHFNWNIPGSCFVMRIGSLADMQDFADLFLRKISIRAQILNALKSHTVFLLSNILSFVFL